MTVLESKSKFKAEVRGKILHAAREIFVHDGYESFSLRKLAQRIGYSPGAIYKHFASKAEIFDSLIEESFAILMQASASVKDRPDEDPVERLKRGVRAYVNFGLQNPDHYRFAFLLPPRATEHAPKPQAAYAGLRTRVQKCIDAQRFQTGNADLMAQSIWAAAHGVTSLLIQRPSFPWASQRKLIAQVIDHAVDGYVPDSRESESERRVG